MRKPKADNIGAVRKMVAGRLPQWGELEGKADRLLDAETRRKWHAIPHHPAERQRAKRQR